MLYWNSFSINPCFSWASAFNSSILPADSAFLIAILLCVSAFSNSILPAAAAWADSVLASPWALILCISRSWSAAIFCFLLSFNNSFAIFKLEIALTSIASSKSIPPFDNANCIFCSNAAFCSSSGETSIKIPKECKCKFFISSNMFKLYPPTWLANSSLSSEYSSTSEIRKEMHSAIRLVINKLASRICFVAVFEFNAAIFCRPTNECGSGLEASTASFIPVTSLIIFKYLS